MGFEEKHDSRRAVLFLQSVLPLLLCIPHRRDQHDRSLPIRAKVQIPRTRVKIALHRILTPEQVMILDRWNGAG